MDLLRTSAFLFTACFYAASAYTYPTLYLDNYCNKNLTIPCPAKYSTNMASRGGRFAFSKPNATCAVVITLDSGCSEKYGLYFNFKEVRIESQDTILVTENSTASTFPGTMVKRLDGFLASSYASYRISEAQLRSSWFSSRPSFILVFVKNSTVSWNSVRHAVVVDWTILGGGIALYTESPCPALGGNVLDVMFCDQSNRISCPSSYTTSTGFTNRATNTYVHPSAGCYVAPRTTPYYYNRPTTSSYEGLDTGPIVGIVFSCTLLALSVLILALRMCARASMARSADTNCHTATRPYAAYNNNAGPAVQIGGFHPQPAPPAGLYPVQQQLPPPVNMAAPPPSYDNIYPTPGPAGANVMPEPPKF